MAKLSKETQAIIEAIRVQPDAQLISAKSINVIVMAIVCAVGAMIWDNVTSKTPETFSNIQTATTEIRANVLELKTSVTDLNSKFDRSQQQSAAQLARISALETAVVANKEAIAKLNDERHRRD